MKTYINTNILHFALYLERNLATETVDTVIIVDWLLILFTVYILCSVLESDKP